MDHGIKSILVKQKVIHFPQFQSSALELGGISTKPWLTTGENSTNSKKSNGPEKIVRSN